MQHNSLLGRKMRDLLEKRDRDSSQNKIAEHAMRTSYNGTEFSQRESDCVINTRRSLEQLHESQERLKQHRNHINVYDNNTPTTFSSRTTRTVRNNLQPQFKWQSDTLNIKSNQISGWLRKTVQQVKLFQKSQFPLRFYVVNLPSKQIYIFDKPGGKLKHELSLVGLRCVIQLNANVEHNTPMSPKTAKDLNCLPQDFPEPFAIFLKDNSVFLLWAKNHDEQTLWRRELKQLIEPADRMEINSAGFVEQNERNMSYAYQLFQQLQSRRFALQDSPRQIPSNPSIISVVSHSSIEKKNREEASATTTDWLCNFFTIFKTSVEESTPKIIQTDCDKQSSQPVNMAIFRNGNTQNANRNTSQSMHSISEDILFQSSTCFQMDYVLMGYCKVMIRAESQNDVQSPKKEEVKIQVKDRLALPSSEQKKKDLYEVHFCVINFNLRKYAMVRVSSTPTTAEAEIDPAFKQNFEPDESTVQQFTFTELETVQSVVQKTTHSRIGSGSDSNQSRGTKNECLNGSGHYPRRGSPSGSARWQSELHIITNQGPIPLLISCKKEKQLWLAELSRAIEWIDGPSPAKVSSKHRLKQSIGGTGDAQDLKQKPKPSREETIEEQIKQIGPAEVEGLSLPSCQFFCYKNFMTGFVKVKVSNFESILRTSHSYPVQKLKLILKPQGSSLCLEAEKGKHEKIHLKIMTLEKVNTIKSSDEMSQTNFFEEKHQNKETQKRKSSFGRLINRVFKPKNAHERLEDEIQTRYGFTLKTQDTTYTLFTSTGEETDSWVRVFATIIAMNRRGISIDVINPFDYEKVQKSLKTVDKKKDKKVSAAILELKATQKIPEVDQKSQIRNRKPSQESESPTSAQEGRNNLPGAIHPQIQLVGIEGISSKPVNGGALSSDANRPQEADAKQQSSHVNNPLMNKLDLNNGNGLALRLENCNVQQILIQVNDQSQLSKVGLDLPHRAMQVNTTGQPNDSAMHRGEADDQLKVPISQGLAIPQPSQERSQLTAEDLKLISPGRVDATNKNNNTRQQFVRKVRGKQFSSAMRKEKKLQQTKQQFTEIVQPKESHRNQQLLLPPDDELARTNTENIQSMLVKQNAKSSGQRSASSFQPKRTRVIKLKKRNKELSVYEISRDERKNHQQAQEIDQLLKEVQVVGTTKTQKNKLNPFCQMQTKNIKADHTISQDLPKHTQELMVEKNEFDQENLTSFDALRANGVVSSQRESHQELPTFPISLNSAQKKIVFNPKLEGHATSKQDDAASQNYLYQGQPSARNPAALDLLHNNGSRHLLDRPVAPVQTAVKGTPIYTNRSVKPVNFEQRIENQRDSKFLDRLIGQVDTQRSSQAGSAKAFATDLRQQQIAQDNRSYTCQEKAFMSSPVQSHRKTPGPNSYVLRGYQHNFKIESSPFQMSSERQQTTTSQANLTQVNRHNNSQQSLNEGQSPMTRHQLSQTSQLLKQRQIQVLQNGNISEVNNCEISDWDEDSDQGTSSIQNKYFNEHEHYKASPQMGLGEIHIFANKRTSTALDRNRAMSTMGGTAQNKHQYGMLIREYHGRASQQIDNDKNKNLNNNQNSMLHRSITTGPDQNSSETDHNVKSYSNLGRNGVFDRRKTEMETNGPKQQLEPGTNQVVIDGVSLASSHLAQSRLQVKLSQARSTISDSNEDNIEFYRKYKEDKELDQIVKPSIVVEDFETTWD